MEIRIIEFTVTSVFLCILIWDSICFRSKITDREF